MSLSRILSDDKWFTRNFNLPQLGADLDNHLSILEQKTSSLSIEECDGSIYLPAAKLAETRLLEKKQGLDARLLFLNDKLNEDPVHQEFLIEKWSQLSAERDQIIKNLEQIHEELKGIKSLQSFLKIIKIDVELVSLCDEFYGDERGLINQAWSAFQKGIATKARFEELEKRKEYLNKKKIALQPDCSDILMINGDEVRSYLSQFCALERRETLEAIALVKGLEEWCNGICPEGKAGRFPALQKIFACYVFRSVELNLEYMRLTSLPAAIGQLVNLKGLALSSNQLERLPPEIGQLLHLERLELHRNQFQTLPLEIGNLVHLTTLDMSSNQLQTLPGEIGRFENLKQLYLSNNQLQTLPGEIGCLKNLEQLYLSNNRLQILPGEIGRLVGLKKLDISSNKLQTLSSEIGQLVHLIGLDISSNELQALPPKIGRLAHLTKLDISSNKLQTLPSEIGQLVHLEILCSRNNRLQNLPAEIGQLVCLKNLDISGNQIQTLPAEIGQLLNLETLWLLSNELQEIPLEIGQLVHLARLNINRNQLQTLPPEIGRLNRLEMLWLQENQLQTLPPEIGWLVKLKGLMVSSNSLQALPSSLARLPFFCQINAERNRCSYEAIQAFQAQIVQQHALNPYLGPGFMFSIFDHILLAENSSLHQMVTFWITQFLGNFSKNNIHGQALPKEMFDCENFLENIFYQRLHDLSEEKANNLKMFLMRLKKIEDFKHPSSCQPLIVNVVQMLHGICTNESFSEKCFLIFEDALSTCGDRVADALNMIYLQRELLCGSANASLEQLARLLIGARRLDMVEAMGRQIIQERGLGDAIETLLYLKENLPDLGLPIATKGMLYPDMSGIIGQDLQTVRGEVLQRTSSPEQILEILLSFEEWRNRIIQENKAQFETIDLDFQIKMEVVCTSPTPNLPAVLEALQKARNEVILCCICKHTQKWLEAKK